ncbi:MAG: hypothetical protein E6J83_01915 [Deltaproteobacteria bacterium]|nr:MAG: hypothetical protein E6J83_01915 [Deltaproteobacteria bacterium]
MSRVARIAVLAGDTPGARAVAGAVTSLLTAVGRWVEELPAGADLAPYTAVILPRSRGWRAVRERHAGPLLVVDADLLGGRADLEFRRLLGEPPLASASIGETRVLLPHPLPPLAGPPLGETPHGLVARADAATGYALPVVLTPALRTVAGFWSLARLVEEAVAALLDERTVLYAAPWPRGVRAARALTYDLDGLEADGALPPFALHGRPATLFCTADALGRLDATGPVCEIAAHGDVHRGFADARTNLTRVDRMLETFRAAGLTPRGFSPPNSTYSSELAPLLARFSYVRIGYQERALRFYPHARADGLLVPVSYYTDFLQRYVGPEECARLLRRFCTWAEATSVLAVPCFHPCLWPEPLRRFLEAPGGEAWEATLVELSDWWMRRRRALAAVSAAGEGAAPPDLVLVRATPAERLAALQPPDGKALAAPRSSAAVRVAIGERQVSVVPATDDPAAAVEVPLAPRWRPLGWLPGPLRRAASRALVRVVNETGMHGCFYRDLGLSAEIVGGALRLPVVAADEPVLVRHRVAADVRRAARGLVRRLSRRARALRANASA